MRALSIALLSTALLNASTVNLDEILQNLTKENNFAKSIQETKYSNISKNNALSSREALKIFSEGVYAKPHREKSGYEYGIGIEQNFINPNIKDKIIKSASYQSEAEILDLQYSFALLENDVRLLYHTNCLDQEAIVEYERSYDSFFDLYVKKEKAYKYGEISKREFLQLQIELEHLKNKFEHLKSEADVSRKQLESVALISFLKDKKLYCQDIEEISNKPYLEVTSGSLKEASLEKKIESLQSDVERYNASFDSFLVSASYQNELDTDRFMLGLSIPLNFTTSLNRENRSAAMHKKNALIYEKEGVKIEQSSKADLLREKLLRYFRGIDSMKMILSRYENELMPLQRSAYMLGESSAVEYLLSERETWDLKEKLIIQKKEYFQTLFELYNILKTGGNL